MMYACMLTHGYIQDTDYYDASEGWNEDRGVPRTNQWRKTNGCPSAWGTATRGRNLRYLECRGQGLWDNEDKDKNK